MSLSSNSEQFTQALFWNEVLLIQVCGYRPNPGAILHGGLHPLREAGLSASQSDTPGKAGGLMSRTAPRAGVLAESI
jgi:hypothetical protein